jgi:hypothetical protein
MKRMGTAILAAVLAATGSFAGADVVLWGHTGFDSGTTSGVVFICRAVEQASGRTAITLAAGTVTGVSAFVDVQAQDAIPGTNISFRTSGIVMVLAGKSYLYRISAKGSDSSITVLAGAGAPAESGTTSDWRFWNTNCYRQTGGMTTIPDAEAIAHSTPWTFPGDLPVSGTYWGSSLGTVQSTSQSACATRLWVLKDILGGGMAQENSAQHNGVGSPPATARQLTAFGITSNAPVLAALHTRITFSTSATFATPNFGFLFALMRE